jgi:hypothetical protein
MSENYNPQNGDPNPHGGSSPDESPAAPPQSKQPPVYLDPNSTQGNQLPPGFVVTGDPGGGKSAYLYPAYAAGRNYGAVSQKEADRLALIALVLGVIAPFFLGVFLSIPGYFLARHAERANGYNAKAAKIVNLVSSAINILIFLFFVFLFLVFSTST